MRLLWVITFLFCLSAVWPAEELDSAQVVLPIAGPAVQKPRVEPQILSIFPLGASRATRSRVEVRGQGLEGAGSFWSDCQSITGAIKAVEEITPDEQGTSAKATPVDRIVLEVFVAPDAGIGTHPIRIVSPRGVSNPLPFVVLEEPVVVEGDLQGDLRPARRLPAPPVVVSGKIGKEGEVDYYSFETHQGQELFFEVLGAGNKFDPQVAVYEPAGSWFDPRGLRRLAFNDEPSTASENLSPTLTWRFDRKGRFLVSVAAFLGRGSPDYSYLLRIVAAAQRGLSSAAPRLAHENEGHWQERSFTRKLGPDRLRTLGARTVEVAEEMPSGQIEAKAVGFSAGGAAIDGRSKADPRAVGLAADLTLIAEEEPKEGTNQALEILVPSLIEGTIDRPGDVDRFRFRVSPAARLAFDIETPGKPAPFFTPRLGVFDEAGQEVLNNVYAFVQGSGEFIEKVIEPKVTYKFERGGEYLLEIQDLTSRNSGSGCRYRVLVRPQIPHVGRIEVALSFEKSFDGSIKKGPEVERLNLAPGEAKKITALTEQEEGFRGEIAVSLEGLPPGVEAFPATQLEPERPRVLDEGKKERFRPGNQMVTILIAASPDAPFTPLPHKVRLNARPVVNGRLGPLLPVQAIPMMVVRSEETSKP